MPKYNFKKYQPLSLRLWHWLNAATILGLLATVLIRKTFLSWRTNSVVIQEKLSAAGTTITPELAKEIAVTIRNPLWDLHVYLGYALAALFLGRLLIALFVQKKGFDVQAIKGALGLREYHYAFVKLGYLAFYWATALMLVTGFLLNFKSELGLASDFASQTKEFHELMMWFFVVFVGGHIVGVVLAENSKDQGLVSDMINGGDQKSKN